MFTTNIVPGQGFQKFRIRKQATVLTPSGRAVPAPPDATDDYFFGIMVNASQREIEQWKQNGHPISHKIVEYSAVKRAIPTDWLVNGEGREFYVEGVKNPGELNVSCIYFVNERLDIRKKDINQVEIIEENSGTGITEQQVVAVEVNND